IVIGERDAPAASRLRGASDHLRRGLVHQRVRRARLGEVPVLAELAREVAAGGAEGECARAGEELVERLLLDRIDAESRRAAVGRQHHGLALALTDEAGAALAIVQSAVAWTEVTLDAAIVQRVPVTSGIIDHECSAALESSLSFHLVT